MLPTVRTHTDALIAALQAMGLEVGDAVAPDDTPPYVVVYAIPGGTASGTLARPDDDAELVYQVTCVGLTRQQAEWLADKALTLLETPLSVSGRSIARVALDLHAGVSRDDSRTPPYFVAMPRFRLYSTPA